MQCYCRAHARELVDLSGITELFLSSSRGCRLDKFPETSTSVGEAPGREFNPESLEGIKYFFTLACVHSVTFLVRYLGNEGYNPSPREVTDFFRKACGFALHNELYRLPSAQRGQKGRR